MSPDQRTPRTLDRQLLRAAGEHLGTLAEQSRESLELIASDGRKPPSLWFARWSKLSRLAREVLEVANGG